MTKFGKAKKIGLSSLGNRSIRFLQFQNRIKEWAKHEDLKIQVCLKHEKGKEKHQGALKISKFCMLEDKVKRNKFPFSKKFKFQMDVQIKF
jgi:hypothetical protein